jgi:hypothetical protein
MLRRAAREVADPWVALQGDTSAWRPTYTAGIAIAVSTSPLRKAKRPITGL